MAEIDQPAPGWLEDKEGSGGDLNDLRREERLPLLVSSIDVIADHNDATGEAVTCVYGIPPSILMIGETVQEFMQRLQIETAFAQLTRPNGWRVWIKGSGVSIGE